MRGIPEQKFNVNRACFPKEKHQNSQKWAKLMNFSFWPFLWFGVPGRLLIVTRHHNEIVNLRIIRDSNQRGELPNLVLGFY